MARAQAASDPGSAQEDEAGSPEVRRFHWRGVYLVGDDEVHVDPVEYLWAHGFRDSRTARVAAGRQIAQALRRAFGNTRRVRVVDREQD